MRLLGYILAGCIALAALQATAQAFILLVALGLLVSLMTRPLATLGVLFGLALIGMANADPGPGLFIVGLLIIFAIMSKKG